MGRRATRTKGRVQQWQCTQCGRWGSEPDDPYHRLFPGFRFRVPAERLLQALALIVVGPPLNWIEKQVSIKAETIQKHFWLSFTRARWELLETELQRRGVPKGMLPQFHEAVLGSESCEDFSRRRGQQWRRMKPRARRKAARLAAGILGRAVAF